MAEISVQGLNQYFGERQVLRDLSFDLAPGERVGLVGPNGCGKTTLLKILAGEEEYESGTVSIAKGARLGLLEQLPVYDPDITVREVLWQAFAWLEDMGREMHRMEEDMAAGKDVDLDRYSRLQTAFELGGGYDLDVAYDRMTHGLKIDPEMQGRPFMSLSGGEKTRVNLARLMLSGTDLLLLDEPTNHLDMDSIEWLEEYLKSFRGAVLIVSHDRYFLDHVTTRTLELRDGTILSWPGNYSYFAEKKDELARQLEAAKRRQDKEIARLEKAVGNLHLWAFMGNDALHKRAFSMQKRIDRMERIQTIRRERKMKNQFNLAAQSGEDVFAIEELSSGYDAPLIRDFSAMVYRGERIAILGPNGCGKTTLLTTLLGLLPPLHGIVYTGTGVEVGYLPQVVQFDHPERTLVDTLLFETGCSAQEARDRLAAFAFQGETVFKTVDVLSGGEKTRLKLCLFMYRKINTLFLDEPTNHLDILSREWVEDAIDDFSETMLFVSHDRYFIDRFATRIWLVEDGHILDFEGGYQDFLAWRERRRQVESAQREREKKLDSGEKAPEKPPKAAAVNQKEREKRRRERARRIAAIEERLPELEEEMAACEGGDYVKLGELYHSKESLEDELLALYEEAEADGE
ncbi:MAG: ABC-F family ATP-binding cassette domain-containing protein [Clostridia bacterium]|nr:ABC-F family ATP-binding cassette domain-containing protein [Clostridia bacterium]MDY2929308.1 ABC-F family ATP-binding cassette domain-containing protein [Clostridiaceae bacterium]